MKIILKHGVKMLLAISLIHTELDHVFGCKIGIYFCENLKKFGFLPGAPK